ncbi:G2/mitotic-specific cyclin-B3-like [Limulus polyphemus]|uniref:G2/mitotic-specific cyclin-B3-like n=1 Tax=Limulus polyphemus TaxID=6850 RepID=A0ABM1BNX2_LIMPO|nr:G2/mitotic-specific cyclin-B3-like [Limulus polyphemus]
MTSVNVLKGPGHKAKEGVKNDKLVNNISKRSAENSPEDIPKKRSVFGDITNALVGGHKKVFGQEVKKVGIRFSKKQKKTQQSEQVQDSLEEQNADNTYSEDTIRSSQEQGEDTTLYITAVEEQCVESEDKKPECEITAYVSQIVPSGVFDFDQECLEDPFSEAVYAKNIFSYYRERELMFPVEKYLRKQPEISKSMRAILVDWMVEVQESFELNHETLYLAVKLVDHYLMNNPVPKASLQLVGATAIFIACKFDERIPPVVDEFLYICDDAYSRKELLQMEIRLLKNINFDLGIPLSYRFLRRYARCDKISMEVLTLARYILETALMDYDLVDVKDSLLAAAALFLALKMKNITEWSPTLEYYSCYKSSDLEKLVLHLNKLISTPLHKNLQTVRTKYSHK